MKIKYQIGDLFEFIDSFKYEIIIPHIVNIKNCWGAGFVIPLARKWPQAKSIYHSTCGLYNNYDDLLGEVQCVYVRQPPNSILVAHMFAQTLGGKRPLFYNALYKCMDNVAVRAKKIGAVIIAPMFGSGLAGGNWSFIKELIEDCWLTQGIPVTIFKLK